MRGLGHDWGNRGEVGCMNGKKMGMGWSLGALGAKGNTYAKYKQKGRSDHVSSLHSCRNLAKLISSASYTTHNFCLS